MKFSRQILIQLLWLLPVAFWAGNTNYDAAKFTILGLATGLWLAHASLRQWQGYPGLPLGNKNILIWGSFVILMGISLLNASNPTLVVRTGLLVSLFALVTFQTSRQTGGLPRQNPLLAAVTLGAVLVSVYGLLQMASILPGAPPASGYPPGISTLGNQNYLAGFLATAIWPTLILALGTSSQRHRMVVISALGLILLTLILAGATGPQVALLSAAALVTPCLILVSKGLARLVPVVLAGLLVIVAATGFWLLHDATTSFPEKAQPSLHHRLLAANHGGIRAADWHAATGMLKSDPLTGVGAGNYLVRWPEFRAQLPAAKLGAETLQGTPISTRAHNDLLQWLAETGLAGVLFLLSVMAVFALAWRRHFLAQDRHNQTGYILVTAGVLTVAIHSTVSFPLHLPATSLVLAFLLGLLFLNENAPQQTRPGRMNKVQSLALAVAALALVSGSIQEFRGDLLTASGRGYFKEGKIREAVAQLEKGVHLQKWPHRGNLYLALAQTALGRGNKAEENFHLSINDHPSYEAFLALAESVINHGDFPTAVYYLDLVKNCDPQPGFIRQENFHRGFMLVRQGQLVAAREKFSQLLWEDADQHRALLALGYIEARLGRPRIAEEFYNQAIAVIDNKLAEFRTNPGQESAAFPAKLQQNRQVAVKALKALTDQP